VIENALSDAYDLLIEATLTLAFSGATFGRFTGQQVVSMTVQPVIMFCLFKSS